MSDIHTTLADLRTRAEEASRTRVKLTTQAEEATRVRDASLAALSEMGVSSPEDAIAEAEKIESEVTARVAELTEALS